MSKLDKLNRLVELEGFEGDVELAERFIYEGTVPGICMNVGCDATYMYEPDQSEGYCDECQANTVQSAFILMGII